VEVFAVVADSTADLLGARMGPTVPPTERTAWVRPLVEPGQWAHVAVRAYAAGDVLAISSVVGLIYQPEAAPPGSEPEFPGGSEEWRVGKPALPFAHRSQPL